MAAPLACIVCGYQPVAVFPDPDAAYDERPEVPLKATSFSSHGHYGSTVYDPPVSRQADNYIGINVCDECLKKAAAQGRVTHATILTYGRDVYNYAPWRQEADLDPEGSEEL